MLVQAARVRAAELHRPTCLIYKCVIFRLKASVTSLQANDLILYGSLWGHKQFYTALTPYKCSTSLVNRLWALKYCRSHFKCIDHSCNHCCWAGSWEKCQLVALGTSLLLVLHTFCFLLDWSDVSLFYVGKIQPCDNLSLWLPSNLL